MRFLGLDRDDVQMFDNSKILPFIKWDITYDSLFFKMKPTTHDVGAYYIEIIDDRGLVIL